MNKCEWCGGSLEGFKKNTKYCTDICGRLARKKKEDEKKKNK